MPVFRLLPIVLFVLVLLMPALSGITGYTISPPLAENRVLTARPVSTDYFNEEKLDWLGYSTQFNGWFSDGFPTRDFWVRLHGQVQYSLFHDSNRVHIGPENWLYYRSVLDVENPSLERISPQERQAMAQRLQQLSAQLAARGITLYILPMALKDYYYPEFLPASGKHALQFRFFDLYMDELLANGAIKVIDSRPILRQAKQSGLKIFHQTDFHWTDPASARVFQALLAAMAEQEQKPALANQWQVETVEMGNWSGGESNALPLLWPRTETTVGARFSGAPTQFTAQTPLPAGVESAAITATAREDLLAPVLIFGDSFFDGAERAGFLNFFQAYTRSRVWTYDLVEAYRNRQSGTRYPVLENITGAIYGMDAAVTKLIAELATEPAAAPTIVNP
jgi:hypothetical protein